jgi:protein SCO1/2
MEVSAVLLPTPRAIPPTVEILQASGPGLAPDLFGGDLNYVFFGFTNCPDVCPLTLQTMAAALSQSTPAHPAPRMIFISVDPERDDPAKVQAYVDYFDPRIVGATATEDNLAALAEALGVAVHIEYHQPGEPYSVDHSAGIYIVDTESNYRGIYRAPHNVEQLVSEFGAIRQQLSKNAH